MNKKQRMDQAILKHGFDLKRIFPANDDGPVTLCKKLRRLEVKATRLTEEQCNIDIDHSDKLDRILAKAKEIVGRTFPETTTPAGKVSITESIFINQDPRGYALKIDDQCMRDHNLELFRDWGGYGILAPDFKNDNS